MRKILLSVTSAAILVTATVASAQDSAAQSDRFKPRIYGDVGAATASAEAVKAGTQTSDAQLERVIEEAYRVRNYQDGGRNASSGIPASKTIPAQRVPANSTEILTHVVKKGDTLYNLSKRYDVEVEAIQNVNGVSGNRIEIGQSLSIPAKSAELTQASAIAETIVAENQLETKDVKLKRVVLPATVATDTIYAVLPKDTLYSISKRSCVKVGALADKNGLSDPNTLKPGQKLIMPEGHCLDR